jgi:uncharacterized protein (DUF1501 family)
MNRRDFLRFSGILPFIDPLTANAKTHSTATNSNAKILILVELSGGNDGLNTLIPHNDPHYYRLRPNLAIPQNQVLSLQQNMGLHPALKPLLPYWNTGQLAWVQGVGYPNASRSHFRSINVWETARSSGKKSAIGWLDKAAMVSQKPVDGIILDDSIGPLSNQYLKTLSIESPERFIQQVRGIQTLQKSTQNPALAYVLQQQQLLNTSASNIAERLQKTPNLPSRFPQHDFAQQMYHAARLIASGVDVPIYKVGLTGFDTHAKQIPQHSSLLSQLATGLAHFAKTMQQLGLWDQILIMSYSEFGRRVAENGASGTDHGAASSQFILGGQVNGGIYGKNPQLEDLDQGDLKYSTDFRRIYHTVSSQWLRRPIKELAGFRRLDFL